MSSNPPKVLHIITRLDPGGSATNTIVSVDLLRKHGFDTSIAYGVTRDRKEIEASMLDRNLNVHYVKNLVRAPNIFRDLLALHELKSIIRNGSFDIIHTHSSKAGILGRIAAAACGVPAIHTAHGHIFYGYFGKLITRIFVFLERWAAKRTEYMVSLTDMETDDCLELNIGKPEQYVTIHSGVPLSQFRAEDSSKGEAFRKKYNIPEKAFLFVSVGRLVDIKGFDTLIQGFSRTNSSNLHLAAVGDGDEREPLEELCRHLDIADRVHFTGELQDITGALSAADAFALASRNEGMGRAIIEAMSAALPVIATAVGGVPSIIDDGKNGLIVPPEAPESIAHAMDQLADDPELCSAIGARAAESVYPEYDEQTMIDQLAGLYTKLLSRENNEV